MLKGQKVSVIFQTRLMGIVGQTGKIWFKVLVVLALLCIVFSGVKFLTKPTQPNKQAQKQVIPEQAQDTFNTAQELTDEKPDYNQDEQIYKDIMSSPLDTKQTLEAQKELIISYIIGGKDFEAQQAYQELLYKFYNHKDIETVVCQIADKYWDLTNFNNAHQIYQDVVDNWPESLSAMWAQSGLVRISILNKEDSNKTQPLINKLLTDYKDYENIEDVICKLADEYRYLDKYEDARELYQYIKEHYPKAKDILWSHWGMIMSDIALGNDPLATGSVDEFINNFSYHPHIAGGVFQIAEEYRKQGNEEKALELYNKALQLYQHALSTWPNSENTMRTKAGILKTNILLGNVANAQPAIDELLAEFPDQPDWTYILYDIAMQLHEKGKYDEAIEVADKGISKFATAYPTDHNYYIKGLCYYGLDDYEESLKWYDKLLEQFPESSIANEARIEIGRVLYFQGKYKEAVDAFKTVLYNNPNTSLAKEAEQNIQDIERIFSKK